MAVRPYKKRPKPPVVAMLDPDGVVWSEKGRKLDLDALPENHRIWAFSDTVATLISRGIGEGLCWNGEEVRWRHKNYGDEDWKNRPSDVLVIKAPVPPIDKGIRALADWRDWLASFGASPVGTTGASAWSLLRASIRRPLWLGYGDSPPLISVVGGRQQLGIKGSGRFQGICEQIDLPAAYANHLGHIQYGGRWVLATESQFGLRTPEWWGRTGAPVFVQARVKIPAGIIFGPLPSRPKKKPKGHLASMLLGATYPKGVELTDIWTIEELYEAELVGCKIMEVTEIWAHIAGKEQPFLRWWDAIQEGRKMKKLPGLLAKMTGNALWGRFCMDAADGERKIRFRDRDRRRVRARPLLARPSAVYSRDYALAESISGRVRAQLFGIMRTMDDRILSVHTDGAWIRSTGKRAPDGWRTKVRVQRLDLLGPQTLRYVPIGSSEPVAVFAGVPAERALESFAESWRVAGYAP